MCTIPTPEPAPPGLYFHAKDYDTSPKPTNGKSVADVHAHRRSQMVNDAFTKLDRLRGALKQLRYMDETGHIGAVLPHLRKRIGDVQVQLDAVMGDVEEALCRYSSPDDDPESAAARVPIQDHETFERASLETWADPDPAAATAEVPSPIRVEPYGTPRVGPSPYPVPTPKDIVRETNDATLRMRRGDVRGAM